MCIFNKIVEKSSREGKLNEGQYALKPWLANLIMGILELVLVVGWLFGGLLIGFKISFSLRFDLFVQWAALTSLILAGLYLVWNLLVWCIKPLRTRFNYNCSFWNLLFIIWLIVDACRMIV